jgi:outer membrane protein assembly factor BamB
MAKLIRNFLIVVSTIGLSACGSVVDSIFDESYEAEPEPLVEFVAEIEPQVIWTASTGGSESIYSDLSPWIDENSGVLYTVDQEGDVTAMSSDNGSKLWSSDINSRVFTGIGGGDGFVFVGTQEGRVMALSQTDGKLVWQHKLTSEVLAPPAAADNIVVIRTSDGRISGLAADTGIQLWSYQRVVPLLSLRGVSAPVIAGDKVIAGYANGKLVALSLQDGKVIWEKSVALPRGRSELDRIVDIDASPVVKAGIVYVVSYNGKIAALAADSGDIYWSREMSSRAGLDVAVGDAVFVSDESSYVWAIQDGTGDALWRQTRLLRRNVSAPAVVGNYIVVGDLEGYLHWISRYDGRFVAREKVSGSAIVSKPVVYNGLLYVMAVDGKLSAIQTP